MNFDSPYERDRAFSRKADKIHSESMEKYGWYAHYIPGDKSSPMGFNAHTHGFSQTWNHPDVQIVIPMPQGMLHGIFITMAGRLKEGNTYEPGRRYEDVLKDFDVIFAWAREGTDDSGNPRRVLRMILPDKENRIEKDVIEKPFDKQWEGTEE